jgi:hypothetical protein
MRSEDLIDGRNDLRFPGEAVGERSGAFGLYRDHDRLRTSLTVYLPHRGPFSREPAGAGR